MKYIRYPTPLRLLLALVASAALLFLVTDAVDRYRLSMHPDQATRDPFLFDLDTLRISQAEPEAAQAGVRPGFLLRSINGARYTGRAQWESSVHLAPGQRLQVGFVRPDGSPGSAAIVLAPHQPGPGSRSRAWQQLALLKVPALFCLLVGTWVVLAKPTEPNAWLVLILLLYPEALFAMPATGSATGGWLIFRGLFELTMQTFGPLALLPFALYFPERSRLDVRLPWLKWALLGPAFAFVTIDYWLATKEYFFAGGATRFTWIAHRTDTLEGWLTLAFVALALGILTDKLLTASNEDAKRRLRLLLLGTGIGLTSLLTIFVLLRALGYDLTAPGHVWLAYTGVALYLVAPLSLAYVVLVQRAMDVSILVRQGTKYALARASMFVMQTMLLTLVSYQLLTSLIARKQMAQDKLWQISLFILLLILLRFGFRNQSATWLDKRFFREAYNSERVLSELSEEVRRYTESGPLLQTVARCVADTLHVNQIGMLLQSGPEYLLDSATGPLNAKLGTLALRANSSAVRKLTFSRAPVGIYREQPDAWYLLADQSERQVLDELGAEILLPLPGRNRLMGVMALGPKQSEAAYTKSDLTLLQVLATQTGMALEVSELAHSLASEAAQRESASREMEIAREVQERLLPQSMPRFAGGAIAGAFRPAQGVGGDYYDAFPLQDGRLGLAIGDVSGKGISAALLMASLRASLRGVTLDNPRDFAAVMEKINRLVYESSADNRYATFFFGALDPETRLLECVNAGHNPPLLLRQKAGSSSRERAYETLRLEADGPVVGLLPLATYSQQKIVLQPGDLLLSYTDGISEAMTRDEEEWGEERMLAAAVAACDLPVEEVVQAVFAAADEFTAGAPQHDDMSLLILKLDPVNVLDFAGAGRVDGAEQKPVRVAEAITLAQKW